MTSKLSELTLKINISVIDSGVKISKTVFKLMISHREPLYRDRIPVQISEKCPKTLIKNRWENNIDYYKEIICIDAIWRHCIYWFAFISIFKKSRIRVRWSSEFSLLLEISLQITNRNFFPRIIKSVWIFISFTSRTR